MAKGFNFQAKMGLDTKNFKKGVNQLKASLNSLKSMFTNFAGTLGVGFGLKIFTDNLRDTALRLDTAMNTLKNASTITKRFKTDTGEVSVELNKYAENLQFVKDLSSKYGQDLISLTDNYAKFIAASKGTNISLEDQKFVFEALTIAAAAYHLSADRTSDIMNAVVRYNKITIFVL